MNNVIRIGGDGLNDVMSTEEKAIFLENLAAQVRTGEVDVTRGVVVLETHAGAVDVHPFGDHNTWLQLAGLLTFAQFVISER